MWKKITDKSQTHFSNFDRLSDEMEKKNYVYLSNEKIVRLEE